MRIATLLLSEIIFRVNDVSVAADIIMALPEDSTVTQLSDHSYSITYHNIGYVSSIVRRYGGEVIE